MAVNGASGVKKGLATKWLILAAVMLGSFMAPLDGSIVNTVLPAITQYFQTDISIAQWVPTVYLLTISCFILFYGRLGDIFGYRKIFLYGLAGFTKIHLDASMKCADDPPEAALSITTAAKRTAELCQVTEGAYTMLRPGSPKPCYVIGTEVPIPGGTLEQEDEISVTTVDDVRETIEVTRRAFFKLGLEEPWERVIAVVVQPGVEFGDETLFEYNHSTAAPLARFIETYDHLVYEAHSTDYQTREALKRLVEDHFAILKVGPALTFAFREADYALSWIEEELLARESSAGTSSLEQVLDQSMLANPVYWEKYYSGDESELKFARKYSFSDRSRYYWPVPDVQQALSKLFENLERKTVPLTLLSQYMPVQYNKVRSGELANSPKAWVYDRIKDVLSDYAFACGYG